MGRGALTGGLKVGVSWSAASSSPAKVGAEIGGGALMGGVEGGGLMECGLEQPSEGGGLPLGGGGLELGGRGALMGGG